VPLTVGQGQNATLTFTNTTMMWHPMQKLTVALVADNSGIWMMHCHNTYHQEAGMMTSLNYVT